MIKLILSYKPDAFKLTDYVKDYYQFQVIDMWKQRIKEKA